MSFARSARAVEYAIDARGPGLVAAIRLASGLARGVAPALHASKTNGHDRLKDNGRTGNRAAGCGARPWTTGLSTAEWR